MLPRLRNCLGREIPLLFLIPIPFDAQAISVVFFHLQNFRGRPWVGLGYGYAVIYHIQGEMQHLTECDVKVVGRWVGLDIRGGGLAYCVQKGVYLYARDND